MRSLLEMAELSDEFFNSEQAENIDNPLNEECVRNAAILFKDHYIAHPWTVDELTADFLKRI